MGKVISLSLCFLFLISCGEKKRENTADQISDTVEVDLSDTTGLDQEFAYAAEIFEYRSETLRNYQLYAVYPYQDAAQFLVVRNDEARLLTLNEEKEAEEGQALDDEEFVAAKFLQELETDGITTFGQVELTTRADLNVTFNHSQTKRSLTIGPVYDFTSETGSGELNILPAGDAYRFTVSTSEGDHVCELEGMIRVKGNIGYFQGEPYDATCKLIFFFTERSMEILPVSSNSDCGCGANASLAAIFTSR